MHVSASTVLEHLDYSLWASQRLVDAASQLTAEELTRDFGTADGSVLGDPRPYLRSGSRVDRPHRRRSAQDLPSSPSLTCTCPFSKVIGQQCNSAGTRLLRTSTTTPCKPSCPTPTQRSNPYQNTILQIVLHVVNHATHHRGQVSGFLCAMGHRPPPLDLMRFYHEHQAK